MTPNENARGDGGLDTSLCGGLSAHGLYLLEGGPGAGMDMITKPFALEALAGKIDPMPAAGRSA